MADDDDYPIEDGTYYTIEEHDYFSPLTKAVRQWITPPNAEQNIAVADLVYTYTTEGELNVPHAALIQTCLPFNRPLQLGTEKLFDVLLIDSDKISGILIELTQQPVRTRKYSNTEFYGELTAFAQGASSPAQEIMLASVIVDLMTLGESGLDTLGVDKCISVVKGFQKVLKACGEANQALVENAAHALKTTSKAVYGRQLAQIRGH